MKFKKGDYLLSRKKDQQNLMKIRWKEEDSDLHFKPRLRVMRTEIIKELGCEASWRVVCWFGSKFKVGYIVSLVMIEWLSRKILYLEIENLELGNGGNMS